MLKQLLWTLNAIFFFDNNNNDKINNKCYINKRYTVQWHILIK